MRVGIVGAGAIGGLLGARLALSGQEVSVFARGDNLTAIRERGLTLIEPDGSSRRTRDLAVVDDLRSMGEQDIVVLSVKAHQIRAIAETLPSLYHEESIVLTLQNGIPWWFFQKFPGKFEGRRLASLDPDGLIETHIPSTRILGCIAYPAAEREGPGVIRLVDGDRFPVGELDGRRSDRARVVSGVLTDAGFTSRALTDIRSHLWVKAWGNLAFNPISALTRSTLTEICAFVPTRELAATIMSEAAELADRLGLSLRVSIEQRIEGAARVGGHKTSMLQDLEAGRALEIDALVGAFVELGELAKVPMPATRAVLALVALLDSAPERRPRPRSSGV